MKRNILISIYIILLAFCPHTATAQVQTQQGNTPDSIRISLLTCASGGEIYALFGHTAIRYENLTRDIDNVFNYGMFNFNAPNFIFRFALGETDYQLGVTDYERFAAEYNYLGRDVWQQTLNLNQEQKERFMTLLEENYRPENRVYRYNFFYDNCTTRPRDLIEKVIGSTLQYADNMTDYNIDTSFRHLLHKYSEGHLWSRFGMDLCMGSKADNPINRRLTMFIPFNTQHFFNSARIVGEGGQTRPLVSAEEKIVITGKTDADHRTGGVTPMQASLLLIILITAATIYGIRKGKTWWGIDLALFLAAGLAGCVLAFLALFSQHPAVSPNYLLFIFHPFHLLCLPCMLNRVRKRKMSRYMLANFIVLALFITLWALIPQRIDLAVLPLALCLLIRSANNLIITYKQKQ